ncbi:MAG TPA: hypothetical protein VN843_12995 [Anaerolineales bacterium]|nr:hypothetical protein [Anaerolineales bacterium]
MKRFAMALALMCALSISIFAGEMPTGGKAEQPPPPATASTSSTVLVSVILTVLSLK